jgi:hypothetical protein
LFGFVFVSNSKVFSVNIHDYLIEQSIKHFDVPIPCLIASLLGFQLACLQLRSLDRHVAKQVHET